MNILHGQSAGGTFISAFKAKKEDILIFHDVLSCGPLKKYTDIEDWKAFRESYWNGIESDNSVKNVSYDSTDRDFYSNFSEIEKEPELKLWIGTGLSDQLLHAYIVNVLDMLGFDLGKLLIFQFEKFEGKDHPIQGLGLLNANQIKDHPSPYVLNNNQIAQTKLAWEAITDSNPERYLVFMASLSESMPLLKEAMSYILYRYPNAINGLSYWDETLLKYTDKFGPRTAKIIGYTLIDCLHGLDLVGDFYLFSRLKKMGMPDLYKPLVEANAIDLPMRDIKITILPFGKLALENKINVIQENGIDDWVGAVHLDSEKNGIWLRKNRILFYQKL